MLTIDKIKIGDEIYDIVGDGEITGEKIAEAVNAYLAENPVKGVDEEEIKKYINTQIGGALNGTY